jgi:hemerythrin
LIWIKPIANSPSCLTDCVDTFVGGSHQYDGRDGRDGRAGPPLTTGAIDMSSFFEWDPEIYSVRVPRMDRGHQDIIACMNRLHTLSQAKAPLAQLARTVDELVQVTVKHFAEEEAYMESVGFADLPKHKIIHKTLLSKVMEHKSQFLASGRVTDEFFAFLKVWLKAHICGIDVKYAPRRMPQRMSA